MLFASLDEQLVNEVIDEAQANVVDYIPVYGDDGSAVHENFGSGPLDEADGQRVMDYINADV